MKTRPARLAVLLTAIVGLAAVAVPPAQAEGPEGSRDLSVFEGWLELSGGLKNPGTGATPCMTGIQTTNCVTLTTGPQNEPQPTVAQQGNSVGFQYTSGVCVTTTVDGPGGTQPTNPACSLTAWGVLRGFNGLGTGVGMVSFMGGDASFSVGVQVTLVGDVLTLAGGNPEFNFRATIMVGPDPEPEPKQEDPPPPPPRRSGGLSTRSG